MLRTVKFARGERARDDSAARAPGGDAGTARPSRRRDRLPLRGPRAIALFVAALLIAPFAGVACSVQADTAPPPRGLSAADPLRDVFASVPTAVRSRTGAAVTPVGGHDPAQTWGETLEAAAWSTIKVPLAVAAGVGAPEDARAAITASDNAAAARLWESLGDGPEAAEAVTRELRRGGDDATLVRFAPTRPPYTPYGQTPWRLTDAARYTASLPCRPEAAATLADMGHVVEGQRWGLGRPDLTTALGHVAFKGGWGPQDHGYVARQLGVLTRADGSGVAVALLAINPDGYDAAVADLDVLALALGRHTTELPTGRCAASAS